MTHSTIEECNEALAAFDGASARLWIFEPSLRRLVLRVYGIERETQLFIVVGDAQHLAGPLAWENSALRMRVNADVCYVEDSPNGFSLRCGGGLVVEKHKNFAPTGVESIFLDGKDGGASSGAPGSDSRPIGTDYANDLKPAVLPPWVRLPDGTWERSWEVAFQSPPSDDQVQGLPDLSEVDFHVRIARCREAVRITTAVVAEPLSDEHFVWAPRRVLRRLEDLLGPMVSINGLPREWFGPH